MEVAVARSQALSDVAGRTRGGSRHSRPPASLWLPAALVAVAVAIPLVYLLLRAFGAGGEIWDLLLRRRTLEILGRTVALAGTVTTLCALITLPLAWLIVRTDMPLRRTCRVLSALPLVIPSYVAGLVVVAALGPRGALQQLLAPLGVERLPEIYGFPGATLTVTMVAFPYMLLTLMASMRGLDPCLEEASRSMGCSPWRTFWRVVFPQLRPALAAGGLLVALYSLRDFGAVSLLKYETFTWAIYLQYQTSFDRVLAAALAVIPVLIAVIFLVVEMRTRGRSRYHRATGTARPSALVRLGQWKLLALSFCSLVILLSVALPVAVLGYWLGKGFSNAEPLRLAWSTVANSGYASALAAAVAAVAAIPVAILSVRHSSKPSVLLERATYVGFALPGIVIALALVFFAANYAPVVYQTLGLLVVAYVILFLPQAVGSAESSLRQVNPHIEDAARSLGSSPTKVIRTITVPLLRPGIVAGAALVFLTAMKELPATLILGPIGFKTLATSAWSAASEGLFASAALPALLLLLVSSAPMAFLTLSQRKGEGL
ncbi:MAG: iron ABC transporter permease [Chloroflexi bacterium]|nr:iron ABC transporter permease [Chloroflexota bacterium]